VIKKTWLDHAAFPWERIFPILQGMVANIDILTGEKTVLSYLIRPPSRLRSEALRE
jgi:membrane fusion protein, adhesin transport system